MPVVLKTGGGPACRCNSRPSSAPPPPTLVELHGVAPQPASSGRHRLSRGGDRADNSALYVVTILRMRHHQPTRGYVERRTAEGLNSREVIRCLKRTAREIYNNLSRQVIQERELPATEPAA